MTRLAADTSALIALAVCDALSVLDVLFDEVKVPPAVLSESAVPGKPGADAVASYVQDKVAAVAPEALRLPAGRLGQGEREAIALAQQMRADFLLVDDAQARRFARLNGVSVIGSLGVLVRAKERGLVEAVKPYIERIRATGIHLSDALVEEALRLAGEA